MNPIQLIFILFCSICFAFGQLITNEKVILNLDKDDSGVVIKYINSGERDFIYILGETNSISQIYYDFILIKCDASGDTMWTRISGGYYNNSAKDLIITQNNNILLMGVIDDSLGKSGIYLEMYTPSGNKLWTKILNFPNNVSPNSIIEVENNQFLICGESNGDVLIVMVDSSGNMQNYMEFNLFEGNYTGSGDIISSYDSGIKIFAEDNTFRIFCQTHTFNQTFVILQISKTGDVLYKDYFSESSELDHYIYNATQLKNEYIIVGLSRYPTYPRIEDFFARSVQKADNLISYFNYKRVPYTESSGPTNALTTVNDSLVSFVVQVYGRNAGNYILDNDSLKYFSNMNFYPVSMTLNSEGEYLILANKQERGDDQRDIYLFEVSNKNPQNLNNFKLFQNFPNPFNTTTNISYELQIKSFVNLTIYDISGREVKNIVNSIQNSGKYSVTPNFSGLSSGIYIYRLKVGSYQQCRKMILLK